MENNNIVKVAAVIIVASVVAPIVVATVIGAGSLVQLIGKKIEFSRQMKKGIKEGTIVKIDGKYYEVEKEEA